MDLINWFLTTFSSWFILETVSDTKIKVFTSLIKFSNFAKGDVLSQKRGNIYLKND